MINKKNIRYSTFSFLEIIMPFSKIENGIKFLYTYSIMLLIKMADRRLNLLLQVPVLAGMVMWHHQLEETVSDQVL